MDKFSLVMLFFACQLALMASLVEAYGPHGDKPVRGVNLGGWLVLEKWIKPSLFQGAPDNVNDEYTLCKHLGPTEAAKRFKAHRDTWVTEKDIIELKNAGVNHLRIPIGYWAFEIPAGEPWVKGSWNYVIKAINWAKKHGMLVMVDLHGAPGSQNGNDHSGRSGSIGFFYKDENLNLATKVIGKIAQIVNSTEYRNTVSIIQLLNEPILWGDDYNYRLDRLKKYYKQAYDEVRKYNDIAVVAVHDAFIDYKNWVYLRDDSHYHWIMLDTHIYQVFNDKWKDYSCEQHAQIPCQYVNPLREANSKLWTVVGEWSLATPKKCSNQKQLAQQQIGVYEMATGWMFWNFKHELNWKEWDFMASVREGWINLKQTNKAQC